MVVVSANGPWGGALDQDSAAPLYGCCRAALLVNAVSDSGSDHSSILLPTGDAPAHRRAQAAQRSSPKLESTARAAPVGAVLLDQTVSPLNVRVNSPVSGALPSIKLNRLAATADRLQMQAQEQSEGLNMYGEYAPP